MIKKRFGEALKAICKLRHMDKVAAAALFEVSPSAIEKYWLGINMPEGKALVEMAEKLNVSLDVLVGREPITFEYRPKTSDPTKDETAV